MILKPFRELSESQVESGLKTIVAEGLAAEAMMAMTGGTFLVAIAVYLGASDFQLGLLAALPMLTNLFQLAAIWFLKKYNSRKLLGVIGNILGRFPLIIIGLIPIFFSKSISVNFLLFLMLFHYFFGSIANAGWGSWMKDLVPPSRLSSYYSQRTRQTQILSVTLSIAIALLIDYFKDQYPDSIMLVYSLMFIVGGVFGLIGVYFLYKAPEPEGTPISGKIFELLSQPFVNINFRRLLIFQSAWTFALGIGTPFFTAYSIKVLHLPISIIIGLGILSQLTGILLVQTWGKYADKWSNKTVIRVCAPMYIVSLFAWIFTATLPNFYYTITILILINIATGFSASGINLALNSIVIKLAPHKDAIVFLTAKSIVLAIAGAVAPLLAGLLGDFFSNQEFVWEFYWKTPKGTEIIKVVELRHFRFLFLIGGLLAIIALQFLKMVKEEGEVDRESARAEFRSAVWTNMVDTFNHPVARLMYQPYTFSKIVHRKIKTNIDKLRHRNSEAAKEIADREEQKK